MRPAHVAPFGVLSSPQDPQRRASWRDHRLQSYLGWEELHRLREAHKEA